jgi:hypothetical protein
VPAAGRPSASGRLASLCLHHLAINGAAATQSTASTLPLPVTGAAPSRRRRH